jgi:DNA repair protein RadC
MEYQSIKSWPEDERPRERLLKLGADELSTAQLIAIILRTGGRKKSALELARELMTQFSSLKEIEGASLAEFSNPKMKIKGIGKAKFAQLKAAFELGRRLISSEAQDGSDKPSFRKSSDVFDYYRPKFYGLKKERFLCALLDTKNRIFKESVVSEGTLTSSLVHPREVFRSAIKEASASVLFVHNHPSGDTTPSRDDVIITERLVETGKIVGIEVLDHIIISDGGYLSLFEKGYINK